VRIPITPVAIVVSGLSGFAALQYEVLWTRQLRELIGGTTTAGTWVVAWFFVGLSLGAWQLGPGADASPRPWRRFARLEVGILLLVLPALVLDHACDVLLLWIGETLWGPAGGAVKALLAGLIVVPPALLMGGTLPALGSAVLTPRDGLGRRGAWLYGLNTLGGAAGVIFVSFVCLPRWGAQLSFLIAIGCGAGAAAIAFVCDRTIGARVADTTPIARNEPVGPGPLWLAGLSGFGVLAAEVLVLIALSQVFRSAMFCLAAMLAVVIVMLGVAAMVAPVVRSGRQDASSITILGILLLLVGLEAVLFPWLFLRATGDLQRSTGLQEVGWFSYIARMLWVTLVSAGPLFLSAGLVLPVLFRFGETRRAGGAWGRLLAANAVGGFLGAWSAGALLMPTVGLWGAFAVIGPAYSVAGCLWLWRQQGRRGSRLFGVALAGVTAIAAGVILIRDLPVLALFDDERVLEVRQGREGIAAAVYRKGTTLRLNNYYWLGGTSGARHQRRMGFLPMLLHPAPRRVAHVGMGTGISAAAPLADDGVEELVALELSPLVVQLAREHFYFECEKLFRDRRSRILIEDGRTFLRASPGRFDVVTGDLFTPWNRGVGSAYTREHFRAVRASLREGGVFCQWLPTYQLDVATLEVIVATFVDVFPDALLMHGTLEPGAPSLGLIGFRDDPVGFDVIRARCAAAREGHWAFDPLLRQELGVAMLMIGRADRIVGPHVPRNTTDNGWVEFHAPVMDVDRDDVFVIDDLFYDVVGKLQASPTAVDDLRRSLLRNAPPEADRALLAGARLYYLRLAQQVDLEAYDQPARAEKAFAEVAPKQVIDDPFWR